MVCGGCGWLLGLANEGTTREKSNHSYELMERYVMPEFQDLTSWIKRSRDWTLENKDDLMAGTQKALDKAIADHDQGAKG